METLTTTNPKVKEQTVHLVKDYLKNLVKANVLSNDQLVETISKLKKPEMVQISIQQQEKLLTKKEMASMLGYKNPRTIDRIEKKGLIERVQVANGNVRFRLSDAHKLIGVVR